MSDPANSSSPIALFRVVIPPKLLTPATSSLFVSIGARPRHRKLVAVVGHEAEEEGLPRGRGDPQAQFCAPPAEVDGLDIADLAVRLDGRLLAAAPRPGSNCRAIPEPLRRTCRRAAAAPTSLFPAAPDSASPAWVRIAASARACRANALAARRKCMRVHGSAIGTGLAL